MIMVLKTSIKRGKTDMYFLSNKQPISSLYSQLDLEYQQIVGKINIMLGWEKGISEINYYTTEEEGN